MKITIITLLTLLSISVHAQDNINQISKKPYAKNIEIENKKTIEEKEKINKQINHLNLQFISKRPYVSNIK